MLPGLFFLCASNVFSAQQIQVGTLKIASGESKTLTGTTVKRVAVAGGEAAPAKMTFSGEGLVEVPDAGLNLPGSFTVEFDVAFEATGGNPYLLSKRAKDTSDVTSGYWIELVNGRSLEFVAAGAVARATITADSKRVLHIAAIHKDQGDGKGVNLIYVDGVQKGSGEGSSTANPNDAPLTLGDFVNGYHEFHGTISALKIAATAELPAGSQTAGAAAPGGIIPDYVVGERDTLVRLIGDVRKMLDARKLMSETLGSALSQIEQAANAATSVELIAAPRAALGSLVGTVASRAFPGGDFIVWQRNRWANLDAHDWPEKPPSSELTLSCAMARDAYGSQGLVLTSTRGDPTALKVIPSTAAGTAPQIRVRRGWQIACPDMLYRPDPLVLARDGAMTLGPGETTLLWFEIDSHGVPAGDYRIPIGIESANTKAQAMLNVKVYGVAMPAVLDCVLFNYSYLTEMGFIRPYQQEAMEDLRSHYINSFVIPVCPPAKADAQGNLVGTPDFAGLDKQIALYRKHAKLLIFFWGADANAHLSLFPELKFLSDPWKKALAEYYRAWLAHMDEAGLSKDQYVMYVYDERSSPEVQEIYALLKQVAPDVRLLLNPTTGYNRGELEKIAKDVGVWQPSYEALVHSHPEDYEFLKSTGKDRWIYSCSNGTPMPTYDYNLRRHWVAWSLGCTGLAQWAYADHGGWESDDSWRFVRGAFAMVYASPHAPPGLHLSETLTPSRRWEAWRQGAQDYQLLNMARARAKGSPTLSKQSDDIVAGVIGQPKDLDAADCAREAVLELLTVKE